MLMARSKLLGNEGDRLREGLKQPIDESARIGNDNALQGRRSESGRCEGCSNPYLFGDASGSYSQYGHLMAALKETATEP
jgi:hypothetical protein